MPACEKCGGTGKIEKPICHSKMGEVDCDLCEGTGNIPEDIGETLPLIVKRLDRIIELLEAKKE